MLFFLFLAAMLTTFYGYAVMNYDIGLIDKIKFYKSIYYIILGVSLATSYYLPSNNPHYGLESLSFGYTTTLALMEGFFGFIDHLSKKFNKN